MNINHLSERFKSFAIKECKGSSQLYEHLSIEISKDKNLIELTMQTRESQPIPNLLLGAVHYLLLNGKDHKLKKFYPSLVENPRNIEESFDYFKDFCYQFKDEIIPILKNKIVQTNEVGRCSYLYPTFCYISNIVQKPLALIEIGTSAGLQLFWDKYSYSYGTNEIYGDKNSGVHITAEIKGENSPFLQEKNPSIASRVGVDLNIMDVTDDEDNLWLQALIWPNHHKRRELFNKAVDYVRKNQLTLIKGDGVALLSELSKQIPKDHSICVFHTHVANQMPSEVKKRLLEQVKSIGTDREIFHIYNNMQDKDLHLDYYINGKECTKKIAKTEGHGRWFSWEL
ncbi:hypothetical protein SAMN04487943_11456 [Gracilibacillus orientalis]|uniref:DUF2332 domain-containing protein n=1 Tax=Gracilibacillus orientalis TaxID=334253 RepID=A0A1I4Q3L7_9BACI|nr:DUF2332 domain-containing protein [Gracilibacillus orientalis]SFM34671.1 hypothetical protein SAMN04487943_11456 [Gracilibacillus orientalis]